MNRIGLTVVAMVGILGLTFAAASNARASMHETPAGQPTMSQDMMDQPTMGQGMMGPGLMMPAMDPSRGRELFASKGCVVCHSVNGVGGEDAPPLDAAGMPGPMNPFEFAAKMWGGADAMIYLQREELGEQISFTGADLADIIAFVHHPGEQKKFSEADIPPRIAALMHHGDEEATGHGDDEGHDEPDGHGDAKE